jgi:hypothetical protein
MVSVLEMKIRVSTFRETVKLCEDLLKRAQRSAALSPRAHYAQAFLRKAALHGRSMLVLMDQCRDEPQYLDISAICILARCVIELHNASVYLCERGISRDEYSLREQLFLLNHASDLQRINSNLGISEDDHRTMYNRMDLQSTLMELNENPIFRSFDEPHRKNLLKGRSPYLVARYAGRHPLVRELEAAAYNLFSHNVHSFSLGLTAVVGGGSVSPAGPMNMLFLAVELTSLYLCHMAAEYQVLRKRAVGKLAPNEERFLKTTLDASYLEQWISHLRERSLEPFVTGMQ